MMAEIGDFFLLIALFLALGLSGAFLVKPHWGRALSVTLFVCLSCAFASLLVSFAISDFSLKLVFENSSTIKPFIYKITGAWGNHEGSMLLLLWIMALYNFVYSMTRFSPLALSVHAAIVSLFLLFIYFTSNPFELLPVRPQEGAGLNPLLQDIGLAMHPPMLYMGYIGFSLVFSLAISVLFNPAKGSIEYLIRDIRKWTIFAWSFLTVGIGLGSWWAYRELGWGGFWFWDPVENSSLMPWLTGTALLHSVMVAEKRLILKKWTVLLAIITFTLSLVGLFLVRSGILTSVHAFASDPTRGVIMLAMLALISGSALLAFGLRAHTLSSSGKYSSFSREGMILYNNLILSVVTGTILIGTLYPLLLDLFFDKKISVGAPFYNMTIIPFIIILVVLAALGSRSVWTEIDLKTLVKKTYKSLLVSLLISTLLITFVSAGVKESLVIVSANFLIICVITEYLRRFDRKISFCMVIAHAGFAILILGVCFSEAFEENAELLISEGEKIEFENFNISLKEIVEGRGENYVYRRAIFELGNEKTEEKKYLEPESRIYPQEQSSTTEAAIYTSLLSDFYIVIGDMSDGKKIAVKLYFKPLINFIWLGVLLMFIGGMLRFVRLGNKPVIIN